MNIVTDPAQLVGTLIAVPRWVARLWEPAGGDRKGVRTLLPERPEGCFAQKGDRKGVMTLLPERPEGCFAQKGPDPFSVPEGLSVTVRALPHFSFVEVCIGRAEEMDRQQLEHRTAQAYTAIAEVLRRQRACHPVRLWNYLPDIHGDMGEGLDRYMAFNAGRFRAMTAWLGDPRPGDCVQQLATASAVGHHGADLVIHALAADRAGIGIENPRQTPSYRYSKRFGPSPPCFARATVLPREDEDPLILLGGTASVRGEESMHIANLTAQIAETLENLASLIGHVHEVCSDGTEKGSGPFCRNGPKGASHKRVLTPFLSCIRELRVYYPRPSNEREIFDAVRQAIPSADAIELMPADLCRHELLVEIEGLAQLRQGPY